MREGTLLFLESKWGDDPDEKVRNEYAEAMQDFEKRGYRVVEVPMDTECRRIVPDPRRGKNMWAVGLLCWIYDRDLEMVHEEVDRRLGKKGEKVVALNLALVKAGYDWGRYNVDFRIRVPAPSNDHSMVVMNGNQAVGAGYHGGRDRGLRDVPDHARDLRLSLSRRAFPPRSAASCTRPRTRSRRSASRSALPTPARRRSPSPPAPGCALKTEFIGLAVMAELPLVIVVVQRGSPSTGLPTRSRAGRSAGHGPRRAG